MKLTFAVLLIATAVAVKTDAASTAETDLETNRGLQSSITLKERELLDSQEQNKQLSRERKNLENVNLLMAQNVQAIEKQQENQPSAIPEKINVGTAKVILESKFDSSDSLIGFDRANQKWNKIVDMPDGSKALCFEVVDKTPNTIILRWIEIKKVAGAKLKCSVEVKGDGMSKPPLHYLGGKFQLLIGTAKGTQYADAPIGGGTFDWKEIKFTADIPFDAKSLCIGLGMQGVTGKIYFRNLKITTAEE
jgi:hypothetical protein